MRWILPFGLVFCLAACGYKGALFLPKEPKNGAQTTQPFPIPEPESASEIQ